MSVSVFLSASVPLPPPQRHERYFASADIIAIRDCIRALVTAVMPSGRIVFGGHPAITPMIRLMVHSLNVPVRDHISLYQSRFFEGRFPPENSQFERVVFVDAAASLEESLHLLRVKMIRSQRFDAGVFVGGMEGVEREYSIFREIHPTTPAFPIASTGAAALLLYQRNVQNSPELLHELRYLSLFRRLLRINAE